MIEVLAFQPDGRHPELGLEPTRAIERGRSSHVVAKKGPEFLAETRILLRLRVGRHELVERGDEGLGYVAPPEAAETARGIQQGRCHDGMSRVALRMKARTRAGSLMPCSISTPELTSTTSGDSR